MKPLHSYTKIILFILILYAWLPCLHSQGLAWVHQFGDTGFDRLDLLTIDNSENIIIAGTFEGTVDFDFTNTVFELDTKGLSRFLAKYDKSGNLIWAKKLSPYLKSLCIDIADNILVAGDAVNSSNNRSDIYIAKFKKTGQLIWEATVGGPEHDYGESICIDNANNIYVTGEFQDTADLNPGSGTTSFTSNGETDICIIKLDPDGNFLWAKQIGGISEDISSAVTSDSENNIITTGSFRKTVDFDPGLDTFELTAAGSVSASDIYILKMNESGDFKWALDAGDVQRAKGYSVKTDNIDNIIVTGGELLGTADFNPNKDTSLISGFLHEFIVKFKASGEVIWAKKTSANIREYDNSLAIDVLGNIYLTGNFTNEVDFDLDTGVYNLTADYIDAYVTKLNSAGQFEWAQQFTGGSMVSGHALTVNNNMDIIAGGYFKGTVDFNPGPSTYNLISKGNEDAFILKLGEGISGIKEVSKYFHPEVYPNPTDGTVNIIFDKNQKQLVVEVRNSMGQLINRNQHSNIDYLSINLPEPAGIYFITLSSNGHNYQTFKVINK